MTANKEPETDKIRQPIAACHAAAFAFELLVQWGIFYPREVAAAPPKTSDVTHSAATAEAPEQPARDISRVTYVLNFDADPTVATSEQVAAIEAVLRELTQEPNLKIERVEEGSLRLVVSSPTNAVARLDVPKLREVLHSRFALHLFGLTSEHEVQELSDISEELLRVSGDLLSWPSTLPDGEWLDRPELQNLLQLARERAQRHGHHRRTRFGEVRPAGNAGAEIGGAGLPSPRDQGRPARQGHQQRGQSARTARSFRSAGHAARPTRRVPSNLLVNRSTGRPGGIPRPAHRAAQRSAQPRSTPGQDGERPHRTLGEKVRIRA